MTDRQAQEPTSSEVGSSTTRIVDILAKMAVLKQPAPVAGGTVVLSALKGWPEGSPVGAGIVASLKERAEMGRESYGMYLSTHNGRNAYIDAYQEALDLVMYLGQAYLEEEEEFLDGEYALGEAMVLCERVAKLALGSTNRG